MTLFRRMILSGSVFAILLASASCKTTGDSSMLQSSNEKASKVISQDITDLQPYGDNKLQCVKSPKVLHWPTQSDFSWHDAYTLLWLGWSNLDVNDDFNKGQQDMLKRWGIDQYFSSVKRGSKYLVFEKNGIVYITFRHSDNLKNWLDNLNMAAVKSSEFPFFFEGTKVHAGFHDSVAALWPDLLRDLAKINSQKEKPIILAGHSVAGAQAELTAVGLSVLGFRIRASYLTGTPRVGNSSWVDWAGNIRSHDSGLPLSKITYKIVNGTDFFSYVPIHSSSESIVDEIIKSFGGLLPKIKTIQGIFNPNWLIKRIGGQEAEIPRYNHLGKFHFIGESEVAAVYPTQDAQLDQKYWQGFLDNVKAANPGYDRTKVIIDRIGYHYVRNKNGYACTMLRHLGNKSNLRGNSP